MSDPDSAASPPSAPSLTAAQRKKLRGLAHPLEPVVRLGRSGLSESAASEVERAIAHHELIKVRIAADRGDRQRIAADIVERVPCALIGTVGQIAILYRPHERPEKRRIRL